MRRNTLLGELSAEFLGTFVLILFGVGVVAQVVLTPFSSGTISVHWGWGFAVVMGVYVAGGISGAHINPAVTLGFALRRKFPWEKVLPYWAAQLVGAFAAAMLIRWNYWKLFDIFDPGKTAKSQFVFSTLPGTGQLPVSHLNALLNEVIGTAMLVMMVFALIDTRNIAPAANMAPFVIGMVVFVIGVSLGGVTGYAINPARDIGPRFASWISGWSNAWNDQNGLFYAWVPVVGPLIGGGIGAFVYDIFIKPFTGEEPEVGRVPEGEPGS